MWLRVRCEGLIALLAVGVVGFEDFGRWLLDEGFMVDEGLLIVDGLVMVVYF